MSGWETGPMDYEIEDPADSYDDALVRAADCMILAQHAHDEAEATEVDDLSAMNLARANYFQMRAVALYQFAALIKDA
jgi:formylmethanofuran dehydrogenase subunit A